MKVGDLVTYGTWYKPNAKGIAPYISIGVILEADLHYPSWFVMWTGREAEWELEDELEVINDA